jgi:hypothetical protein
LTSPLVIKQSSLPFDVIAREFVGRDHGLRQIDIHDSPRFITEWLEKKPR